MKEHVKLSTASLPQKHVMNERLVSYNVEFTEVTGGTFWKAYTPEQIAGTEKFTVDETTDFQMAIASLMQVYPPINLYDEKLRYLAGQLKPAWVRISGTWATKTYYDFEGTGQIPEGYQNRLSKEQWIGVLDFVRAVDGKLMISMANCLGLHKAEEPWNPSQAEKIFKLSSDYGVPVEAVEFANEPNTLANTGFPPGYTAADFVRDQDIFHKWVRENYPDTIIVGPCTTEVDLENIELPESIAGNISKEDMKAYMATTDQLMDGTTEKLDVYSYHYYNGVSERMEKITPFAYWGADKFLSEEYLEVAEDTLRLHMPYRDKYCPGGQMWVTESGDASGGGTTWASTYADVFRTLNELGSFCALTNGVIFHNTLASSDYGFLEHSSFEPRPNYFAVLLWDRIMGDTVYDAGEQTREGAHVYAHSRKDGKAGVAYLIINNAKEDATLVELPKEAEIYRLHAKDIRATTMYLNGHALELGEGNALPEMLPEVMPAGEMVLEPMTMAFVVI